jgi:hypothetical protein
MAIVGIVLGAPWAVFLTIEIVADAQDNEPTPPRRREARRDHPEG